MKLITTTERRQRLVARHHLLDLTGSVEEAAASVVGFHSSDPVTVFLSCWARVEGFRVADLDEAMYEHRSLIRMLGMRRTLFVQSPEMAAIMNDACTRHLAPTQRSRLVSMIEDQAVAPNGEAWLAAVEADTLEALASLGEATATELTVLVPELGRKLMFGEGKTWGGEVGVSTRVLFMLATTGAIVRGRPRGSWRSSQYRWALLDGWLDGGLAEVDSDWAEAELLRRWLRSYGPGTLVDLRWWTGWTLTKTRRALDRLEVEQVELEDGGSGLVLADDLETSPVDRPSVALLPGLDPSVMGWKERHWFLGPHQDRLFDRNGNAGPTVWVDGRIVGGWAQTPSGRIAIGLLETVDASAAAAIAGEAERLETWLGEDRFKPRFRAPLEKELAAGP
jgi:hypothetical protein